MQGCSVVTGKNYDSVSLLSENASVLNHSDQLSGVKPINRSLLLTVNRYAKMVLAQEKIFKVCEIMSASCIHRLFGTDQAVLATTL